MLLLLYFCIIIIITIFFNYLLFSNPLVHVNLLASPTRYMITNIYQNIIKCLTLSNI